MVDFMKLFPIFTVAIFTQASILKKAKDNPNLGVGERVILLSLLVFP